MDEVTSAPVAEPSAETAQATGAGSKDLRTFLKQLLAYDPEQLVVVDREVDPVFEATAIVVRLKKDPAYSKFPAVLFKNIKGSSIPLVINLHGTYERLALAIDANVKTMVKEFSHRENQPVPVKHVDRTDAPVKDVVWTGPEADLSKLPILQHQELDAGKYVTSAISIQRDPETGVQNAGIYRAQLHSNTELGLQIGAAQVGYHIFSEYQARKQPMPIALVIGHHPAFLLAGTTKPPGIGGELEVAGGLMQQPLELVKCETVDLEVPARAEIVIEGLVDTDPENFREEGPFGEYPRYYTGTGPQPWLRVTAITTRRDPIYVDIFNSHDEHLTIGGLARMGYLLTRVQAAVPNVTGVYLPLSASARIHAYISIKKRHDGEPNVAAFAAFAYSATTKHIFVVDDDIDISNEADVLWALATRFQADKDMAVIPNTLGSRLNPPTYAYRRDEKGAMETAVIFDCTRPAPPGRFPTATRVPPEVVERVDPADYVRALNEQDLWEE